jgi:hypothetical protein
MTLSRQEEMEERREVVENERRLRNQGTTFSRFAQADADQRRGRFDEHEKATVNGSEPIVRYPQLPASSPWAGPDLVPTEPSLGYRINDLNPTDPPADPSDLASVPPPMVVQGNGPNPALGDHAPTPLAERDAGLGSFSRAFRRF